MVRMASIVAWLQMLHLAHRENREEFVVSGLDISALCQLCNDPSVGTRQANYHNNYDGDGDDVCIVTPQTSSLEVAWAHTVLPLVSDTEATCVMKAVEFFFNLGH